jgi:hypothetical protein
MDSPARFGKAANSSLSQTIRFDPVDAGPKINRSTLPRMRSALRFLGATLSILSVLPFDASSQTLPERSLLEDYSVRHWDHLKGLPESVVTGLSFDQAGFLWLSTTSQLVRFDGVDFIVWAREDWPGKPPALFNHLASDKAGNLWLSGVNGVLRLGTSDSKAWPSFDDANTPEETIATGFGPNGDVYLRTRNHDAEGTSTPLRLNGERWNRATSPESNRDAAWNRIDPDHWRLAAFPSPPFPPPSSSG